MKALLICPGDRPGVARLAEGAPLAAIPWLGKTLVEHWLEHLVQLGASEVFVLADDRPDEVRACVGDGARWGLRVTICPEQRELSAAEALAKYSSPNTKWLPPPHDVILADHFPGAPERPLFNEYAGAFAGLMARLERVAGADRIGLRELAPGIWAGLRAQVAPNTRLQPPCWLGEDVRIGPHAVIGPGAILEDRVLVERGATIAAGVIGPDTFVGEGTEVRESFAWRSSLLNWRTGSLLEVPDAFLLGTFRQAHPLQPAAQWLGRMLALMVMELTVPLGACAILRARFRREPAFRQKIAVPPRVRGACARPRTGIYYEMNCNNRWLKRWPQLWNVATGEFAWVGNRPLNPDQARELANPFEQRWLDAPIGLICLADAHGCLEPFSDEARAHAGYYAAKAGWRLDAWILRRFARVLLRRAVAKGQRELSTSVPAPVTPTTQQL